MARVYIIWGQSNASGRAARAELPAELVPAVGGVHLWNGTTFAPLHANTNNGFPETPTVWGPEMRLGLLARNRYRVPIFIVKHAVGGTILTSATDPTWNPNVRGSLFDAADAELVEALAWLTAKGMSYRVEGFVWAQGEADGNSVGRGPAYQARATELFNAVRSRSGRPELPIADMLILEGSAAKVEINNAKRAVAAAVGNVRLVDANLLTNNGDGLHLDGAAQLSFGEQAFNFFR